MCEFSILHYNYVILTIAPVISRHYHCTENRNNYYRAYAASSHCCRLVPFYAYKIMVYN